VVNQNLSQVAVVMHTAQGPIEGEVKNISPTDASISCKQHPEPNEDFPLVIRIAGQNRFLRPTAKMVRSSPEGIGVRFTDIPKGDRWLLHKLIVDYLHSELLDRLSTVPRIE
jgi:hypothetical protein